MQLDQYAFKIYLFLIFNFNLLIYRTAINVNIAQTKNVSDTEIGNTAFVVAFVNTSNIIKKIAAVK